MRRIDKGKGLTVADMLDPRLHDLAVQGLEPELGTSRGQGLNDAGHIVADEDEASHFAVALHGPPEGILGVLWVS